MIKSLHINETDGYRGRVHLACDAPGCVAASPRASSYGWPTDGTYREAWSIAFDAGWRHRLEGRMQRHYCPAHAVGAP